MGRLNILKISTVPKMIHKFNVILIKIPTVYFIYLDELTLKFTSKSKVPKIAKNMLK